MCMWVRAMDLYSKVFRTVEPKRERYAALIPLIHHVLCYCRLKTARSELVKMMAELKEKEEALEVVETKVILEEFGVHFLVTLRPFDL